jgi:hypothetical protein
MSVDRYVLLIETGGKQDFIFETAKRREAVGASQLIHEASAVWPHEAGTSGARIILAAAGTFLAVFDSEDSARRVLREVTGRAFTQAPGLDVHGTVIGCDWDAGGENGVTSLAIAVRAAFRGAGQVPGSRPHPDAARLMDPFARVCSSTGRPAAWLYEEPGSSQLQPRSAEARAKLDAAERGLDRLADQFAAESRHVGREAWREQLGLVSRYLADDQAGPARVAVIHADGNGMGALFAALDEEFTSNDGYLTGYRDLSAALDRASRRAYVAMTEQLLAKAETGDAALRAVCRASYGPGNRDRLAVPALPLILGGDDLTVICDADVAVALARSYAAYFTQQAAADPLVADRVREVTGYPALGVSIGIADVGAHFPFRSAYELAEQLCFEAKAVKAQLRGSAFDAENQWPVPARAWSCHVLLDGTASSLMQIRADQRVMVGDRRVRLTSMPYVDIDPGFGKALTRQAATWLDAHNSSRLSKTVQILRAEHGGRLILARAQVRRLVDKLGLGLSAADEELRALCRRDTADGHPSAWLTLAQSPAGEPRDVPTASLAIGDGQDQLVLLTDAIALSRDRIVWVGDDPGLEDGDPR